MHCNIPQHTTVPLGSCAQPGGMAATTKLESATTATATAVWKKFMFGWEEWSDRVIKY